MNILFVLIPLGLVLVAVGLWAFFWAVGSGQFDDLDSPGWSVLTDSETKPPGEAASSPDDKAAAGLVDVQIDKAVEGQVVVHIDQAPDAPVKDPP